MEWKTLGHENVKHILEKQEASGRLPHAYWFYGPNSIGKKALALEFAKAVLKNEKLETHPDFQILESQEEIGVEKVRQFITQVSFKPFISKFKVAVIDNAQNLNEQSSNALLKTLEEPPPAAVLILISNKRLLPTIVSRCQTLNFNRSSQKQRAHFTENENISSLENELKVLKKASVSDRLLKVTEYAEKEIAELKEVLQTWQDLEVESLSQRPENFARVRVFSEILKQLDLNRNKKMLLQSLFLKI